MNAHDFIRILAQLAVRLRKPRVSSGLLAFLVGFFAWNAEAQVIHRISAPGKFYVDNKDNGGVPADVVYNYAVYTISNNTGVTIPSIYVALTNIYPTNRIQLAPKDNGIRTLGALAPGETKLAAFYLKGPGFTGNSDTLLNVTNEVHSIQVWAGPPIEGTLLSVSNYSYTNIIFLIEAAANKVTVITNLNPLAVLGSEVTLVIAGDTGTIGGNNSIAFSPGVLGSWRPDAYQLQKTVVRFSQNPTYTNRLYFDPTIAGFTNFAGQTYTNTFLFRAVKVTGTNLPNSPFAFVDSGSGTKHTALSSLASGGGGNQIYSASNLFSIVSHTVTPTSLLAPGGLITYSVTFSNGFFLPLDLDEIVSVLPGLPGNVTYVPGSATFNSLTLTNPIIQGQTLRWAMPFTFAGNGTGTLTFQAIAPQPAGNYTNRVTGVLGNEQIDLTADTTDNSPATSVFTVIPVSDLGLTKSGPSTTPAASSFDYTLTVTNLGPSPASGVAVTDALPAAVTFVSAGSGGFLSGGNVIWTNLSIAASNSATVTVTVTAPPDGMNLSNTAVVSGPNLDPNSTNNVTPPVFTSVTPVADLQLIKTGPPVIANSANFSYTLLVTNHGPSAATNVSVTDVLPGNVSFVSASNGGFLSGGNVMWTNLGTLPANATFALTLTVTAPASGSTTNTASVSSPTADPNGGNNSAPPVVSSVGNVPPTTVNDTAAIPRNTPISVNVLANDSDANGDPLTLTNVTQTNGAAIVNGPAVDFSPATNFLGNVLLTYTVMDGQGGTNTGLLTISVTNRPPVALNDAAMATNGVPRQLFPLVNDSDPDGDALTITNAVASNGTVSINPGASRLTFTATNSFSGAITYTVSDGFGGSATAIIVITGNNIAPTAFNQGIVLLEDSFTNLVYTASDDDTNLAFAVLNAPTNGLLSAFDASAGTATYTPNTNYFGPDQFSFTVFDGQYYATGLVNLTILGVNDAPVATDQNLIMPEDVATNLVLAASDVDSTNLVFAILTAPTNGNLSLLNTNTGAVTYTPATNYFGPDGFTFTVFDGTLYATGSVNLTVSPVNDAPLASSQSVTNLEDVAFPITLAGSDADGPVTNFTLVSLPLHGALSGTGANLIYTPVTNYNGADSFAFAVNDGSLTSAVATVSIVLLPVNDPPALTNDVVVMNEDSTSTIRVLLNDRDTDGDPLVLVNVTAPSGTATVVGTNVVFTPAPNFNGTNTLTYFVTDGTVTNSAFVTVIVLPVDDAPTINHLTVTITEDSTLSTNVVGDDLDGDALTYGVLFKSPTSLLTLNTGTGQFDYTPPLNDTSTNLVLLSVFDGSLYATSTVQIIIIPVNDAPVANNQSFVTPEDVATNLVLAASDVDSTNLTFAILSGPAHGSLSGLNPATGAVTYTPATNYNGNDSFTFTVFDGALYATGTVSIIVSPLNGAPVLALVIPNQAGVYGSPFSYTLPANTFTDADAGQTLTLTASNLPPGITFNATTHTFSGTPTLGIFALPVTVVATDDGAPSLSASATFNISIAPVVLTVTANNQIRAYNQSNPPLTYSVTGFVLGDTTNVVSGAPGLSTAAAISSPVGAYPVSVSAGSLAATNYIFSRVDGTLTVTSATATVTWTPAGPVTYGTPLGTNQNNATASVPGTFTYNPTNGSVLPVGTNSLSVLFNPTDTNYTSVNLTAPLVIFPASLTVTADNQVRAFGQNNPALTYTLTGFVNGENASVVSGAPVLTTTATNSSPIGIYPITLNLGTLAASNYTFTAVNAILTVQPVFTWRQGANVLNPQTGLYEQLVTVTNILNTTVPAFRVLVGDFASTNVWLWNATGTNVDGRRYVQYNSPLDPGSNATVRLEFYNPTRLPFTNSLEIQATLPTSAVTNLTNGVATDRAFVDNRESGNPRFVIEWVSIPGRSYTVIYSDDNMLTWRAATPSVTAAATRTQWYDDGPPKTQAKPMSISSRLYRIIINP